MNLPLTDETKTRAHPCISSPNAEGGKEVNGSCNRRTHRSVCAAALVLAWQTQALADDLSCKPVRDAMLAMTGVKYDARIVTTMPGRTPIVGEQIYTLDATWRQPLGRWIRTSTSPQNELDGERRINATFSDCRHEDDAAMGGETVAVYTAKTRNFTLVPFTGDLKLWVSSKRGVPLRSEANATVPLLGASRTVKTYRYDNIRLPNLSAIGSH